MRKSHDGRLSQVEAAAADLAGELHLMKTGRALDEPRPSKPTIRHIKPDVRPN